MKILLVICSFFCSFSAAASYYSCLSPESEKSDLGLTVTDNGSNHWSARLLNPKTDRTIATFDLRMLSNSPSFVSFTGNQMSLRIWETINEYGHRKAEIVIPQYNVNSTKWICKSVQ